MATPLTDTERTRFVNDHASWHLEGPAATRTFVFADFAEAMGFVNRVGLVAESSDHHPDIDIRWNRVTLTLSTHSAKAFTDLDRALIEAIDSWQG